MAITLFDLTYRLAQVLKQTTIGTATGGSTTTIADTVDRFESDDAWNNGTAWVIYDAGGAGAAPQGEYRRISDYALTGGVVTVNPAFSTAVAAGDEYAISNQRYPLHLLKQMINEALGGVIEKTDITTITIATGQTEYSLPSDLLELNQVWMPTNDDSNDNRYEKIYDWGVQKSATGTADLLVFFRQFTAGWNPKLVYLGYHQTLRAATDKLDNSIYANKVLYNAAVGCLLWYKAKVGDSDSSVNELLNYYQPLADQMNTEFAQHLPMKSTKTIHPVFNRP